MNGIKFTILTRSIALKGVYAGLSTEDMGLNTEDIGLGTGNSDAGLRTEEAMSPFSGCSSSFRAI